MLVWWYGRWACHGKILFGDINPSGKLPVSFPKKLEESPAHSICKFPQNINAEYKEGIFVGYRYFDKQNVEPLFCFGHGLSYTNFKYSKLKVITKKSGDEIKIKVSFNIKNTGEVEGEEVAQIYIADIVSTLERPIKELKSFKKVKLSVGEKKEIELELDKTALAFYSDVESSWIYEAGMFEVLVGSSSRDIRLQEKFEVE